MFFFFYHVFSPKKFIFEIISNFIKKEYTFKTLNVNNTKTLNILTNKEEDIIGINENINIYTENIDIYEKYNNIYYRLPRVINYFKAYNKEKLLTNDIGSINKYINNNEMITDIYSNVTNIYTLYYLHELGIKKVSISPELSFNESIKPFLETASCSSSPLNFLCLIGLVLLDWIRAIVSILGALILLLLLLL